MNKLKIILQSNLFYFILILVLTIYVVVFTIIIKYESKYSPNTTSITGIITSLSNNNEMIKMTVKAEEKVKVTYFYENKKINFNIGQKVLIIGKVSSIKNNTIPNTFNYKKYLYNHQIYLAFAADKIEVLNKENIFYSLKSKIIKRIEKYNTKEYLKMFILGDKSTFDTDIYNSVKNNGIAHLLAISGMHLTLFLGFLNLILKKCNYKLRKIIIILFLTFYLFLTSFGVSITKCCILYLVGILNKDFNLKISRLKCLCLSCAFMILINPFWVYDIGFLYSYIITLGIILCSEKTQNYWLSLIKISIISFLFSLPISATLNYKINIMSLMTNFIMVPYVSFFLYPLSLLSFIFKPFNIIFTFSSFIFEKLNQLFDKIALDINVPKISFILIVFYYLILILAIKKNKKELLGLLVLILTINKLSYCLDKNYYICYFDVGQGDSSALISPYKKEVILIDTGGLIYSDYKISDNVITYLNSIGITKINNLIITHGDADHAKDAPNIIKKMNVKNISLNNNSVNKLEQDIMKTHVNISKKLTLKYFDIKNLNEEVSDNENDSSIINFFTIYKYNFLFVGDASSKFIKKVLINNNIKELTFLKLGHHGSKTSTDQELLNMISCENVVISRGLNNIYHHPSKEVISYLNNLSINQYDTAIKGTIILKISKNDYDIYLNPP